jgi:hypothetical protein
MSGSADIQWPSFQGQATLAGTSPSGRVTVYVDPSLGEPGQQNATDLLAGADQAVQANDQFFGTSSGSVNVVVFALGGRTDGTGGADHLGCDYVAGRNIEVCAAFGNSRRVIALFEAELSECNMGGNLCGVSTGEALSRWCAAVVSDNALADFATAPTWFDNGAPDYVSQTDATDQNSVSIGCGMAFISWLLSQNLTLSTIARALVALGSAGTLAQLYTSLTGNDADTAYLTFMGALRGLTGGVVNDDPFGALSSVRSALAATPPHSRRLLPPWTQVSETG